MKDKEIIEYLNTLDISELNYYKGVVEALIISKVNSQESRGDDAMKPITSKKDGSKASIPNPAICKPKTLPDTSNSNELTNNSLQKSMLDNQEKTKSSSNAPIAMITDSSSPDFNNSIKDSINEKQTKKRGLQ